MKTIEIKLVEIIPSDEQLLTLYNLLILREHFISHQIHPSFEEHKSFVNSQPYRVWYLIFRDLHPIGTFYISNENTIGINVVKYQSVELLSTILKKVKEYSPLPQIKSIRGGLFSINVPTSNQSLISSLKELGTEVAQITFLVN